MARFNDSYYSDHYYGRHNGILAVIVGGLCIWAFIAWADHSAVTRPLDNAEEELRIERQSTGGFRNEARIKACEEDVARQRAYVNSGQSARDLAVRDAEINKGSRTTGDVFWVCVASLGMLVCGWRTVRGVASPFEGLLALVSTVLAVILALSIGIGAFLMLACAGGLVVLMCQVLGDDLINRGRHVCDTYDEEFDVNERREVRQQQQPGRMERQPGRMEPFAPVASEDIGGPNDPLAHRRLPVNPEAQAAYEKRRREP